MGRAMAAAAPTLEGWGRLGVPGREIVSTDLESLTKGATLSRGLGRSYGDSSLPAREGDKVAATRLADRILWFDEGARALRAEAGLSLGERGLCHPESPRGDPPPSRTRGNEFLSLSGRWAAFAFTSAPLEPAPEGQCPREENESTLV